MVKFITLFTNFMLIGLVVFSLLAFGVLFQGENKIANPFIENTIMSSTYASLNSSLASLSKESQAQKTLFESENPTGGFGTILLFSIVSTGKIFNGMVIGLFNTLVRLPITILGVDPIIISVLSTILILTIIIGLWVVYKLGG